MKGFYHLILSAQQSIAKGKSEDFFSHNVKYSSVVLEQYQWRVFGLLSLAWSWLPPVPGTDERNKSKPYIEVSLSLPWWVWFDWKLFGQNERLKYHGQGGNPGKNEAGSRRNLPSTIDEARLVVVTLILIGLFSIERNR